ncbi:MAG: hypothetical protein BGO90_15260 [Legionella sp. 40-6]|nr:hypothetical protein [Legionella sp.]OJY30116.1 MAG: hypothetical protein BGO90_15260 [Legionella sp. 40-6]
MTKQRGFIFLFSIIFMGVISLLILTQFRHFYSYYKLLTHYQTREQVQYKVEKALRQLQQSSFFPPACTLYRGSANQAINLIKAHKGCIIEQKNMHYLYLVEDLPLTTNQNTTFQNRRLTIALMDGDHISKGIQIRYVEKLGSSIQPTEKRQFLMKSWRYFG